LAATLRSGNWHSGIRDGAWAGLSPSAVLCSNDMTAIGVMRAAFDLSLNIPRDLSVIGFDDIRLAQFVTPPLTTVQMSQTEIASLAFSGLLDSLEPSRGGSERQVYPLKTNLVLRQSTALAPGCLRTEQQPQARELIRTEACFESA
jgi:DNA-binding LacI/PurR family transcriptional regulator